MQRSKVVTSDWVWTDAENGRIISKRFRLRGRLLTYSRREISVEVKVQVLTVRQDGCYARCDAREVC